MKFLTGPFSANNPVIVQILGICSALAVTVQLKPAIVMALSVTVVTAFSSLVMSLLRNGLPSRIRIIVQLVVIAALVILVMSVVITVYIRIVIQVLRQECFYCFIRLSTDAAVKPDACLSQSHLGSSPDASADQCIYLKPCEKTRQGAVAAAVSIHHLLSGDCSILDIIDLKLFRVPKMLKHLSVFVSNCYPHLICSFPLCGLAGSLLFPAGLSAVLLSQAAAEPIMTALYGQRFPVDQAVGDLLPGRLIDLRHRGPGDIHLPGTLFLSKFLQIHQADDLILIHSHHHPAAAADPFRDKTVIGRL